MSVSFASLSCRRCFLSPSGTEDSISIRPPGRVIYMVSDSALVANSAIRALNAFVVTSIIVECTFFYTMCANIKLHSIFMSISGATLGVHFVSFSRRSGLFFPPRFFRFTLCFSAAIRPRNHTVVCKPCIYIFIYYSVFCIVNRCEPGASEVIKHPNGIIKYPNGIIKYPNGIIERLKYPDGR